MIIVIFGLPGTGKSYFGERLAEQLDIKYINSDRLRQELQLQGKYGPEEKQKVYAHMLNQTIKLVQQGNDIVLDATFTDRDHLQQVKNIAAQHHTGLKLIKMTADEEVIRERVSQYRKYSEADEKVYEKLKENNQAVEEAHLLLDTSHASVDQLILQAKSYLEHD